LWNRFDAKNIIPCHIFSVAKNILRRFLVCLIFLLYFYNIILLRIVFSNVREKLRQTDEQTIEIRKDLQKST